MMIHFGSLDFWFGVVIGAWGFLTFGLFKSMK